MRGAGAGPRLPWAALLLLAACCSLTVAHSAPSERDGGAASSDEPPVQAPSINLQPGLAPTPPLLQQQHPGTPRTAGSSSDGGPGADGALAQRHQPGATASAQQHPHRPRVPLLAVVLMSFAMAAMSCLGVLPFFFCARLSAPWAGVANAVASGVMLAASFGLLAEGAPYGGTYLILGMLLGVVFVKFSQEHLEQYEVDSFEQLAGADARKLILFLAVMAVHAVGEGGGVGVSFAGDRGWAQGTLVTLAIGLHNVPEGLAVATVMAAKGTSPRRTLLWTALTAAPQALVAPPAYMFVETFRALLPLALGFAAGCMIWIVLAELLPDALEAVDAERVATCATGSAAWLQGLSIWIAHLETPSGTLASPFGDYQAVLPLGLAGLLPQLAPALLLPALLAGGVARLVLLPPPLLTAASGGLCAAYAAACWAQLLAASPHRLLNGLLAPAVGAGVAAALWRQLRAWQQQRLRPRLLSRAGSGKPAGVDDSAVCFGAAAAEAATLGAGMGAAAGHQQQSGSPGSDHSCCNGVSTAAALAHRQHALPLPCHGGPQQQQQQQAYLLQQQHQQLQHNGGARVLTSSAVQAGHAHARHSRSGNPSAATAVDVGSLAAAAPGGAWEQLQHPGSSSCSSSSSTPQHQSLLLPGRGDALLPVTTGSAVDHAQLWGDGCGLAGLYSSGKGSKPVGCSNSRSSQAVAAASWLALGGAAASGVPLGLQLAAALARDPSSAGHAAVPLLLAGCLTGLGCVGFLPPLFAAQPHHLQRRSLHIAAAAAGVSAVPVCVAVAALLSQPSWVQQGSAAAAADSLQGLASGFNAYVLLLLLLPLSRRLGPPQGVRAACGAGAAAGVLACLLLLGLCAATPYCLHVHAYVGLGGGALLGTRG